MAFAALFAKECWLCYCSTPGEAIRRPAVKPVWDQTTIDRLWVTTQREAMIESGPPPAEKPQPSGASEQKAKKEETKK